MIVKRLHIGSKMFIKDPYVIRVIHPESTLGNVDIAEFRRILKLAKASVGDTWGYSNPEGEPMSVETSSSGIFQPQNAYNIFNFVYASYWVFKDRMDALQFHLVAGNNASHVHIWPSSRSFAIVEFVDTPDQ